MLGDKGQSHEHQSHLLRGHTRHRRHLDGWHVLAGGCRPDYPRAVEKVLLHQDNGPVSKLPTDRKRDLIACVNQVLAGLPSGKKRFVTEAASYDELEDRFGKVVMENRAEWKQKIAASCASSAV